MLIRCVGGGRRKEEGGISRGPDGGIHIHPSADINRWQTEMGSAVDPKNHCMHLRWGPPGFSRGFSLEAPLEDPLTEARRD